MQIPYVIDFYLYLGRPLHVADATNEDSTPDGVLGAVPDALLEDKREYLAHLHSSKADLVCYARFLTSVQLYINAFEFRGPSQRS